MKTWPFLKKVLSEGKLKGFNFNFNKIYQQLGNYIRL